MARGAPAGGTGRRRRGVVEGEPAERSRGGACGSRRRVRVRGRGPYAGAGAGTHGVGEKKISFLAETLSKLRVFWYFIVLSPYPLLKTYDMWVRREG
jgi:hypothetical protein